MEVVIAKSRLAWIWPVIALVAVGGIAQGYWLGWTRLAHRIAAEELTVGLFDDARLRQQIELQQRTNAALEAAVAKARQALETDVCIAEFPLGPPG